MVFGSRRFFSKCRWAMNTKQLVARVALALAVASGAACTESELPPPVDVVRPVKYLDVEEHLKKFGYNKLFLKS